MLLTSTNVFKFPDYSDKCPICGGKNCAVKIGFYYRLLYDSHERKLLLIPVQRYKCNRVNPVKAISAHRTFSLLPYTAIPYKRYDIDILQKINIVNEKNTSFTDTWTTICVDLNIEIGFSTIISYVKIFLVGCVKLTTHLKQQYEDIKNKLLEAGKTELRKYIIDFYNSIDDFLFGVPSQKRF